MHKSEADPLSTDVNNSNTDGSVRALKFSAERSIRYHSCRQRFFEQVGFVISGLSIVFGALTIASAVARSADNLWSNWVIWAAAGVAILQTFEVLVGTARRARIHQDLLGRWTEFLKKMERNPKIDELAYRELVCDRLDLEKDEPPVKTILDMMCHNELVRAYESDDGEIADIHFIQRLCANWVSLFPHRVKKKKFKKVVCPSK